MGDLQIVEHGEFQVPAREMAEQKIKAIMAFQGVVKSQLKPEEDFGVIPGTKKPTLYKSGAEKILSILGISVEVKERREIKETVEAEEGVKIPYFEFAFVLRGSAANGKIWESTGSCNSLEKKYCKRSEWKNGKKTDEVLITDMTHYYGLRNTLEKMAFKRAVVSLSLVCGALSNIFTQDLEDMDLKNREENRPNQAANQKSGHYSNQSPQNSQKRNEGPVLSEIDKKIVKTLEQISSSPEERKKVLEYVKNRNIPNGDKTDFLSLDEHSKAEILKILEERGLETAQYLKEQEIRIRLEAEQKRKEQEGKKQSGKVDVSGDMDTLDPELPY